MSISFSIKANTVEMQRKLENVVRKQIPFAASRAVTQTATVVRDDYVLREYRRSFTSRNKAFEKTFHSVAAANVKSTRATGVAVAAIMPRDGKRPAGTTRAKSPANLDTAFMRRHVSGGIKTPKNGRKIAIPVKSAPITRKTAGRGAGGIRNNYLPETLMKNKQKAFIKTNKKGNSILYRKFGRGGKKLQPMYVLKPAANIRGGYNPLPEARRGVAFHFPRLFRRNFIKAIKTAKLR